MAGSHPAFLSDQGYNKVNPLPPLLYVLAAQPSASHLRHQAQQGIIRPINMPDGQPAPVSHQHAGDTTLHVLQPSDAPAILDSSIALFCAATCIQLNVSKSRGFLVQTRPLASASVAALPSISFITGQQTIKHPGVFLGYDMQAASHQQFTRLFFGRDGFHYTSATIAVHKHLPCHQRQGQASGSSGPVMSRQGACGQAGPSCLAVVSCQFRQSFNVRPPGQCLECRHIRLMQLKHCFAEALLS